MSDLYSLELVEAFADRACCPLCRVVEIDERRWMETFRREGRRDPGERGRFFASGGFCRRHAWLFHTLTRDHGSGAPITDVYGYLVDQDIEALTAAAGAIRNRRRRIRVRRKERCPACVQAEGAADRKARFLAQLLVEPGARPRYASSGGLCFDHLASTVELAAPTAPDVAVFLIQDWRDRAVAVRRDLAEFDRLRDYHYAAERTGAEDVWWTEAIRRYVGERPVCPE